MACKECELNKKAAVVAVGIMVFILFLIVGLLAINNKFNNFILPKADFTCERYDETGKECRIYRYRDMW